VARLVDNAVLPVGGTAYTSALPDEYVIHSLDRAKAVGFTGPVALQWAIAYLNAGEGKASGFAYVYDNRNASGSEAQMLIGPQFETPEPATPSMAGAALLAAVFLAGRRRIG
jgi:hypothetical protein